MISEVDRWHIRTDERVRIAGRPDLIRRRGGLTFAVLRDRTGTVQLFVDTAVVHRVRRRRGARRGARVGEPHADVAETVTQLFGGSQPAFAANEPSDILAAQRFPDLGGWFQVGSADAEPPAAIGQLAPLARAAGSTTCLVTMPDQGHTFDVRSAAFAQSLPFFAGRPGLAPAGACPAG